VREDASTLRHGGVGMTNARRPLFDERSRFLDRFGLLLLLTVASITMLSLVDITQVRTDRTQQIGSLVTASLTAAALLVALRAAGLARRWQRPTDAVIIAGVLVAAALIALGRGGALDASGTTPPLFATVLAVLAPVVVVRRLLTHRRVRRETLLGAVSAYLLIAAAFFYILLAVEIWQPGYLFGSEQPTTSFMYFSLTTITTVGYGDLTAVSQPGRLFANAEAVVGQLYLVAFVGLVIGLLTQQVRRPGSPDGSDGDVDD
jgi:hypothetical protein